jgi:hypothetical protein
VQHLHDTYSRQLTARSARYSIFTVTIQQVTDRGALWTISAVCFSVHAVLGLLFYNWPAKKAKAFKKTSRVTVLCRGGFTFSVFLFAMYIAEASPPLAGILVNAPFITVSSTRRAALLQGLVYHS